METPPQTLPTVMAAKGTDAVNEVPTCQAAGFSTPTETGEDAYDAEALGVDDSWGGAVLCSYTPHGDENVDLSAKWTDDIFDNSFDANATFVPDTMRKAWSEGNR